MITTIIILFFIFVGTLYVETTLRAHVQGELVVIVLGLFLAIILLYGELRNRKWTWGFSSIFHSLALANLAALFILTNSYGVALLTMLITLIGLLRSFAKLDEQEWESQMQRDDPFDLETFDEDNVRISAPEVYTNDPTLQADAIIAPAKKRKSSRAKKASKRSSRKRSRKASKRSKKTSRRKSSRRRRR